MRKCVYLSTAMMMTAGDFTSNRARMRVLRYLFSSGRVLCTTSPLRRVSEKCRHLCSGQRLTYRMRKCVYLSTAMMLTTGDFTINRACMRVLRDLASSGKCALHHKPA